MLDSLIKTYQDKTYKFTTMVRHQGMVIAFAMDSDRRIYYSVLELGGTPPPNATAAAKPPSPFDVDAWTAVPRLLEFPNEIAEVGFGAVDAVRLPRIRKSGEPVKPQLPLIPGELDDFKSSTARFTADAAFQVLSDGNYVYVFRQAVAAADLSAGVFLDAAGRLITSRADSSLVFIGIDGKAQTLNATVSSLTPLVDSTLLVDRFVMVGTELQRKLEVRFQRSRSKTRPQSRKDSLAPMDLDGNPFFEPTQELRIVGRLTGGRFAALLLPTQIAGVQRWQIFTHNALTNHIDSYNIERSDDGLFNTRGSQVFTCEDHSEVFETKPGKCARPSVADDRRTCNKDLIPRLVNEGFAESMLELKQAGAHLALTPGVTIGRNFTIETWIRFDALPASNLVLMAARNGAGSVPLLEVEAPSGLKVHRGAEKPVIRAVLKDNEWTHLAVTRDEQIVRVYVNGKLGLKQQITDVAEPSVFNVAGDARELASMNCAIDEIRVWTRTRRAAELRTEMHQRLTGLEPNLAAYWRFDEARGAVAHNQAASGAQHDAALVKTAFGSSDAPVGEITGVSRDSLEFQGRTVTGGLAAVLYHQQADAVTGYDTSQPKPLKRQGRVMLAMPTSATGSGTHQITILDFGVSSTGHVAVVPDVVPVANVGDSGRLTRIVSNDPAGLTISGGVLSFSGANASVAGDAPLLFDSALGTLGLYYRGIGDQFFSAVFDTRIATPVFELKSAGGSTVLRCTPRSADLEAEKITVEVTPGDAGLCTVTISGPPEIREIFKHVPRTPEAMARVLNGAATNRNFAGKATLRSTATGMALQFAAAGSGVVAPAGKILRVGDGRVRVIEAAAAGAQTIRVAVLENNIPSTLLPVFLEEYDYKTDATTNRIPASLTNGSLFVRASALPSVTDSAIDQKAAANGAGSAGRWTSPPRAQALEIEPATVLNTNTPEKLKAEADLTIESWIKPGDAPDCQIVRQQSEGSEYALSLKAPPASALAARQVAEVRHFEFSTFAFTIEAWLRVPPTLGQGAIFLTKNGPNIAEAVPFQLVLSDGRVTASVKMVIKPGTPEKRIEVFSNTAPVGIDDDQWHHVALTVSYAEGSHVKLQLFIDGIPQPALQQPLEKVSSMINNTGNIRIGSSDFPGAIDEVRLWDRILTADEIASNRFVRRAPTTRGLLGYWHFEQRIEVIDGTSVFGDFSGNNRRAAIVTEPRISGSPFPYSLTAAVNGRALLAPDSVPPSRWTHVAASFHQAYAVKMGAGGFLDCGKDATLDITGDLTIEVTVKLPRSPLPRPQALIGWNKITNDVEKETCPFFFYIDEDGKLVFYFDSAEKRHEFRTGSEAVPGQVNRFAATRHSNSREKLTGKKLANGEDEKTTENFTEIRIFADGANVLFKDPSERKGVVEYTGPAVAGATGSLRTGSVTRNSAQQTERNGEDIGFQSTLSLPSESTFCEVRIWNTARAAKDLHASLRGDEKGLVSWYRFEENGGFRVADSKAQNHAKLQGAFEWVKNPEAALSRLSLYVDGTPAAVTAGTAPAKLAASTFSVAGSFRGQIAETRLWKTERTHEQIQDNMCRTLLGEREDLIARYTMELKDGKLLDSSLDGNHLTATAASSVIATAPVGEDFPAVRPVLSTVVTGFEGTVQSAPAIAEYGDMQLDTRGNINGVFKRAYSFIKNDKWSIFTGFKVGDLTTEWVGQVQFNPEVKGYIEGAPPVPSENLTEASDKAIGDLDDYNQASTIELIESEDTLFTYAANTQSGLNIESSASLAGLLGQKFKVGFGLITNSLDVENKIGLRARFEHSQGWIENAVTTMGRNRLKSTSMELRGRFPNDGSGRFQPDNFGIALVQSETADVFALRLRHNNALISYQMRANPDIPPDWNIVTFKINPRYTKQGTLDGKVGNGKDIHYPNAGTGGADASYFKPIQAYALKNRIERQQKELETFFSQFDAGSRGRRNEDTHFTSRDFAVGKPIDKLPQARDFRRNLVNTYVWTADGGLFAETEQTTESRQEVTGGSFEFKGLAGVFLDLKFAVFGFGLAAEADLLAGGHINLDVTKAKDASTSFGLNVTVDKVERDIFAPALPGQPAKKIEGKVDAYRFMTFYLEPTSDNFDAFSQQVADPEWLAQSNDAGAVILRAAMKDPKKPPCWRVLHRVTFVSRVLSSFSNDSPALEKSMRTLDIDSNFELIKILEPFVADKLSSFAVFSAAVDEALRTHLPELVPHAADVKVFLALYYGLGDGQTPEGDSRFGEETLVDLVPNRPPIVNAGSDLKIALDPSTPLVLEGASVIDDRIGEAANIFVKWEKISGTADPTFTDPFVVNTSVTFTKRGTCVLRLTASDGELSASDEVSVLVNVQPSVTVAQSAELGIDSVAELRARLTGDTSASRRKWLEDNLPAAGTGFATRITAVLNDHGLGDPELETQLISIEWRKAEGPAGEVKFEQKTALDTLAIFPAPGFYILELTVSNNTHETKQRIMVSAGARIMNGLQAFYTFAEGSGNSIDDRSAGQQAAPLLISGPNTTRTPDALTISGPAEVATTGAPSQITDRIMQSGELTVEAWIVPGLDNHSGLARIVTLSGGPGSRNFTLGQTGTAFHFGVRTTATNVNASNQALAGGKAASASDNKMTHVIATRNSSGLTVLYVDGVEVTRRIVAGNFGTWDRSFRLGLANEFSSNDASRAWKGRLHLVAIYSRALTPAEVRQNFGAGADADMPPIVNAGPDRVFDASSSPQTVPVIPRIEGRVAHARMRLEQSQVGWETVSGPAVPDFDRKPVETANAGVIMARFKQKGRYVLRLTADDGTRKAVDDVTIDVNAPPTVNFGEIPALLPLDEAPAILNLSARITDSGLAVEPASGVNAFTVAWQLAGGLTFANPASLETTATFTQRGDFDLILRVHNGRVEGSSSKRITVCQRPRIDAGADQVVTLRATAGLAAGVGGGAAVVTPASVTATLSGTVIDSGLPGNRLDGLTGRWVCDDPTVVIAPGDNPFTATARFGESGIYTLRLIVSNGPLEANENDRVTVTVNRPPVVDAGPDQTISIPITQLDGTASDDGLVRPSVELKWSATGPGLVQFDDDTADVTRARFFATGEYSLKLEADDGKDKTSDSVKITVNRPNRISTGVQALYVFPEAPPLEIVDTSGVAPALNLIRAPQPNAPWVGPGTRLIDAIKAANGFSLEFWVRAAGSGNEATIFAIERSTGDPLIPNRITNVRLFARQGIYVVSLRRSGPNLEFVTQPGAVTTTLTHFVATCIVRSGQLSVRMFLNGVQAMSGNAAGSFAVWEDLDLMIGNDTRLTTPWTGQLQLGAIYSRELTEDEILQNLVAGPR